MNWKIKLGGIRSHVLMYLRFLEEEPPAHLVAGCVWPAACWKQLLLGTLWSLVVTANFPRRTLQPFTFIKKFEDCLASDKQVAKRLTTSIINDSDSPKCPHIAPPIARLNALVYHWVKCIVKIVSLTTYNFSSRSNRDASMLISTKAAYQTYRHYFHWYSYSGWWKHWMYTQREL